MNNMISYENMEYLLFGSQFKVWWNKVFLLFHPVDSIAYSINSKVLTKFHISLYYRKFSVHTWLRNIWNFGK